MIMYQCGDCTTWHPVYMVKSHLWIRVAQLASKPVRQTAIRYGVPTTCLCIPCFERRLGRPLNAGDLTYAPCNYDRAIDTRPDWLADWRTLAGLLHVNRAEAIRRLYPF